VNLADTILLLSRPEPAARRFAARVDATLGRFGRVIVAPVIRIARLPVSLRPDLGRVLVFTSANAIAALPRSAFANRSTWCVGQATALAASDAGARIEGVAQDVDGLTRMLLDARPEGRILHAAGRHRRGALVQRLRQGGLDAQEIEVYDQVATSLTPEARQAIAERTEIVAPLFSPRSAGLLSTEAAGRTARIHAVAISPAALLEWQQHAGEQALSAALPDAQSMIATMGRLFDAAGFA
jgi:uroporphyrinogen-III synthase